ncbi:FK506-binding protein 5-like [Diaphorina citri]|uniref:FK506-binding protein 5-like n=1 Tax=Diaphorina citri TaxID=121845 RepID=A0A1S4E7P8_DIACI|nr:FK506-binding protein 5-like [Diaphorina citri]
MHSTAPSILSTAPSILSNAPSILFSAPSKLSTPNPSIVSVSERLQSISSENKGLGRLLIPSLEVGHLTVPSLRTKHATPYITMVGRQSTTPTKSQSENIEVVNVMNVMMDSEDTTSLTEPEGEFRPDFDESQEAEQRDSDEESEMIISLDDLEEDDREEERRNAEEEERRKRAEEERRVLNPIDGSWIYPTRDVIQLESDEEFENTLPECEDKALVEDEEMMNEEAAAFMGHLEKDPLASDDTMSGDENEENNKTTDTADGKDRVDNRGETRTNQEILDELAADALECDEDMEDIVLFDDPNEATKPDGTSNTIELDTRGVLFDDPNEATKPDGTSNTVELHTRGVVSRGEQSTKPDGTDVDVEATKPDQTDGTPNVTEPDNEGKTDTRGVPYISEELDTRAESSEQSSDVGSTTTNDEVQSSICSIIEIGDRGLTKSTTANDSVPSIIKIGDRELTKTTTRQNEVTSVDREGTEKVEIDNEDINDVEDVDNLEVDKTSDSVDKGFVELDPCGTRDTVSRVSNSSINFDQYLEDQHY